MPRAPIDPASLPYRPCVGVMLLNPDGLVWTGRRIVETDSEMAGSDRLWQMPQGGVDEGEDLEAAARRELWEETGVRSARLLAASPDWVFYDLPPELVGIAFKGRYRGQKQRWFAFRFEGEDAEIQVNPPPAGHEPEFDAWAWRTMDELPDLIVPFKRPVYETVVKTFRHLAPPGR